MGKGLSVSRRGYALLGVLMFIIVFIPDPVRPENLLRAPQPLTKKVIKLQPERNGNSLDVVNEIVSAPVKFYQKFLSPYWGRKCSHQPSCSAYSRMAIKKHGAIIGSIMTFDRLQHESNEAKFSPLIQIDGETKVCDPVENNDFWWYKK